MAAYLAVMGFDLSRLRPSYCLVAAFPLSSDVGFLSLVGSSILLLVAVQQLLPVLVFSPEMSARPTLPVCTSTLNFTTLIREGIFYNITLS